MRDWEKDAYEERLLGATVTLQLKSGRFHDVLPDGAQGPVQHMRTAPFDLVVSARATCEHESTLCVDCIADWALDHYITGDDE